MMELRKCIKARGFHRLRKGCRDKFASLANAFGDGAALQTMAPPSSVCLLAIAPLAALANVVVIPRKDGGRSPAPGSPRVLMLYSCKVDFLENARNWSVVKKEWCCQHSGISCKAVTEKQSGTNATNHGYDCNKGLEHWETKWSISQKAWCCENRGKGCGVEYDCDADFADWWRSWAQPKMAFCCERRRRGCERVDAMMMGQGRVGYDCKAAKEREWSDSKKAWCQQQEKPSFV